MPRVHYRKARKDYPANGIKKGDMYYFTKLKLQRGGMVKRSLTPFKPSQLTNSPYSSGTLAVGEGWDAGDKDGAAMRDAAETLREIGTECQDGFDNMPEGLQQGDTGQLLENRASELEAKADELDGLADEYDGLEEPEEMDEPDGDEDSNPDQWADYEAFQDDLDTYSTEKNRLTEEASDVLGDMPE